MVKSKDSLKSFGSFLRYQVIIIGILWAADTTFFFFEQNFFNTYLGHVLNLSDFYVAVMVILSAIVGLIMNFTWGIVSDNTRSKFGRRRPFLLFSITAGIGMVLFAFSGNYILCLIYDVLLIGITSNATSVASRAIIPDIVDLERRGRANGIVQAVSYVGLLIALAMFLLSNELFDIDPNIVLLSFGAIFYAVCGIIGFALLREKPASELPPKKKFSEEIRELLSISRLKEQQNFFKVILAATIFQTGVGSVMAFLFLFIFALGLTTLQLLLAIGVGFLILFPMVILLGRIADKYGRKKFLPLLIVIIAVGFILVPFVEGPPTNFTLFLILIPIVLLGLLGLTTIINTWAQDTLPSEKKGQFYGIFNIALTVSQIIGAGVGGFVSITFGRQFTFVLAAIFFFVSIPLFAIVKETLIVKK
jgi:maltose/moltooligosaccharide transporter